MRPTSEESTTGTGRRWWSNLSLATLATVASVAVLLPFVGYLFHIAPLIRAGFSIDAAVAIYPTVATANGFAIVAVVALIVITFALVEPAVEAIWRLLVRMWAMTGRPTTALERAAAPPTSSRLANAVGLVLVALAAVILLPVAFVPFSVFAATLPTLAAPITTIRDKAPALIGVGMVTFLIAIWLSPVNLTTQQVVLESGAGVPSGPYVVLGEQGSWTYLSTCGSRDVAQVATRLIDSVTGPATGTQPPISGTLVDWLSGRPPALIICDGRVVAGP